MRDALASIAILGLLAGASAFSVAPALRPVRTAAAVAGKGAPSRSLVPPEPSRPQVASNLLEMHGGAGARGPARSPPPEPTRLLNIAARRARISLRLAFLRRARGRLAFIA